MCKFKIIAILLVLMLAGVTVNACGADSSPSISPSPSTSPSAAPNPGSQTAGQLADAGKTVFANNCAVCHGDKGQGITGPTLIGPDSSLDKYVTARGLFDFISQTMPVNAPGSLNQQSYLELLAFLLVQNKFVMETTPLDMSALGGIQLK